MNYVSSIKLAERVTTGLNVVKWISILGWLLYAAAGIQVLYTATTWPMATVVPFVLIVAAVAAYVTYLLVSTVQAIVALLTRIALSTQQGVNFQTQQQELIR